LHREKVGVQGVFRAPLNQNISMYIAANMKQDQIVSDVLMVMRNSMCTGINKTLLDEMIYSKATLFQRS
jgi:hypothetical protein